MKKVKYVFKDIRSSNARWIWSLADNGWADTRCSNCGFITNNDVHVNANYTYCPNCGSKMTNGCKRVYYENDGCILKFKK